MKRCECVVCGSKEFELLYTFEHMPVYIGIGVDEYEKDIFEDQSWYICKKCGCIQLLNLVDLKNLYSISHNPSVGKTWALHNKAFSEYILKYGGSKILEIGGGNLTMANVIAPNEKIKKYKIYDVNCNKTHSHEKIEFDESFFDLNESIFNIGEFNTIVMSHTFEHLYDPMAHLQKFYDILPLGGRIILSMPNIENGIKDKFTNALSFEHTFYIEKSNLHYMLTKSGFKMINDDDFSQHNIFVVYEKTKEYLPIYLPQNYLRNQDIFYNFIDHHKKNLEYLNKEIENHKHCARYLFGSHIFSQFLVNMGLNVDGFIAILDDDTQKQNHRLYGTNLMTRPSYVIQYVPNVFIILQAGIYSEEIANKLKVINPEAKIIF